MKRQSAALAARGCIIFSLSLLSYVAVAAAPIDPGVRAGPGAGSPLPGLDADQTALFGVGAASFAEVESLGEGLGPRFNLDSCGGCHAFPAIGGTSPRVNPQATVAIDLGAKNTLPDFISANGPIREVRFKYLANGARDGGVHSLFVISGRIDSTGTAAGCSAVQEDFASQASRGNASFRIPTPTFGLGLIESIPDTTLTANLAANSQQKAALGIAGHLNTNPNDGRIARFGWKAQNVSLLMFSGEAYNVEMGITNELFPTERDLNASCQTAATPNDISGRTGLAGPDSTLSDIEKFALFMRYLSAPVAATATPGGASSIDHGRQVFNSVGCSMCHTPALQTDGARVAALANKTAALYSDLALHHMGPALADNIMQGAAGPDEFRTAPLWGLGQRIYFLHDGRTSDLVQAIRDHASGGWQHSGSGGSASGSGSSEANRVVANYNQLNNTSQQDLLNFLRSL